MSKFFYGPKNKETYFEGWYFKHQTLRETVALIPAFHIDAEQGASASLQVITEGETFSVQFPACALKAEKNDIFLRLGDNIFSRYGCRVHCVSSQGTIFGQVEYGPFSPPQYSIMGPFAHCPAMECRHTVYSYNHRVTGQLTVNGRQIVLDNALGYMEGDRGTSFPQKYLWAQCSFPKGCIMLSAATIPMGWFAFTGSIGAIWHNGREYRLATYLGLKILRFTSKELWVRQGCVQLRITLVEGQPKPLQAPVMGKMERTIYESAACRVRYQLWVNGEKQLDFISDRASFEYSE